MDAAITETEAAAEVTFELDDDETALLEEFGTLMSAEYNYIMLSAGE
jgi:hypothetical protein